MFAAYIHFNRGAGNRVKYNLLPALQERMAVNIPDPMADWDFPDAPEGGAAGGGPVGAGGAAGGGPGGAAAAAGGGLAGGGPADGAAAGGVDGVVLPAP